jgi:hypothetical protein
LREGRKRDAFFREGPGPKAELSTAISPPTWGFKIPDEGFKLDL